jgi:hypothetical protein
MALPPNFSPLRYLIGGDDEELQKPGTIVEYSYDADHAETKYGTLTSEKERFRSLRQADRIGRYKPYLRPNDITAGYGEWMPDPHGAGFLQNVREQIARAAHGGALRMELDNPDYDGVGIDHVLQACDLVWQAGMRVIAKNPNLTDDPLRYISHPGVDMVVVEHGAGGSDLMELLRKHANQPLLAVRFVSFGDGGNWAHNVASRIKQKNYLNMGVTFSAHGEYTDCVDLQLPLRPSDAS